MRVLRQVRDWSRNIVRLARLKRARDLRVHLGCGDDRLDGFLNVDTRFTTATDVVADLNEPECFPPKSVAVCYSNAFFEHLYRPSRLPHLRAVFEMLGHDGVCCYVGIPYFKNVAKLYLEGRFDLYNVYRYTHGDPESVGSWWTEQLHKSLFDEADLTRLLTDAGFSSRVVFSYCYPGEEGRPVNMGFYARKGEHAPDVLRAQCIAFLREHSQAKVLLETLTFL
jgi:predicted SAM-dependent methyltransferase